MGDVNSNFKHSRAATQGARDWSLGHGRQIREWRRHAWIVTCARRDACRGRTLSLSTHGMPSLFNAYRFSNASTGRNMRPFGIKNTSSWPRKSWLSFNTNFNVQSGLESWENIVHKSYNLLIRPDWIAVGNWGACLLIKVGIPQREGKSRWWAWLLILKWQSGTVGPLI